MEITWRPMYRKQSERDRGLVSIEHWLETAWEESNGHVTRWRYVTIGTDTVFQRTSSCHEYNGRHCLTMVAYNLDSRTLRWLFNTSRQITSAFKRSCGTSNAKRQDAGGANRNPRMPKRWGKFNLTRYLTPNHSLRQEICTFLPRDAL